MLYWSLRLDAVKWKKGKESRDSHPVHIHSWIVVGEWVDYAYQDFASHSGRGYSGGEKGGR